MRRALPTTLAILLMQAMAGCDPHATKDTQAFQVRDSAGVTIYENSEGEWSEATAWRLSSEPILTIGELDGPEEYLLFQVSGARQLSNGNIVIANAGTGELRFYDPNGRHVRSIGGEGDGPGEFRAIGEPWPLGSDSIVVWDRRSRRLTVFDINGEFGRSFRLDDPFPEALPPTPQGILADNSLLVSAGIRWGGQVTQGTSRDSIVYSRYSLEGVHTATSIRRQGVQWHLGRPDGFGGGEVLGYVPNAANPAATVFGDRLYYGSGESWEIGVYSPDGALTHLFRRDEPNRPFTPDIDGDNREMPPGLGTAQQAGLARFWASMPVRETFPAYRSFIASDDGSVWVENYTHPSEQPSWAVFRDDGRYLGEVETPIRAQVTHIGDDFVLVIWEDELGVQQVQMYELIKP